MRRLLLAPLLLLFSLELLSLFGNISVAVQLLDAFILVVIWAKYIVRVRRF